MSYRNLEIWALAREVAIEIHSMSMSLPKFELYEEGSQIRKSSKATKSAIVEGYGRRRYKHDWLKFLVYAHSSNSETIDHLENLWETKSLDNITTYETIWKKLEILGKKLYCFIASVEEKHQSQR
jgi:four helix bundle protein